jgi:polyhydroxybutyrate depolymerase
VKFIDDLVVDLATRACVDPARLYATGISSGAAMSSVLACRQGERFRAIAPVAGVVVFGPVRSGGPPLTVIAFHGTQDPILPYNGGPVFGGGGTSYPGVAPAMAGWAARGGCKASPETEAVSQHVTLQRWPGCSGGDRRALPSTGGGRMAGRSR